MSSKGALPKTKSVTSRRELSAANIVQTRHSLSRVADSKESSQSSHKSLSRCECGEEKRTTIIETDNESRFDLKPKPKIACIPSVNGKVTLLNEIDSSKLRNNEDVNVMYKGRELHESSLSVLFVGSSSILNSPKENESA